MIKTKLKRSQKLEMLIGKIIEIHKRLSKTVKDTTLMDTKLDKFKKYVITLALKSECLDNIYLVNKTVNIKLKLDLQDPKLLNTLLEEYLISNNYGDDSLECSCDTKKFNYDVDAQSMLYNICKEIDLAREHKIPSNYIKDSLELLLKYYV